MELTLQKRGEELPCATFTVPVDSAEVVASGLVNAQEAELLHDQIQWTLSTGNGKTPNYVTKNHYAVLNMIANNKWERPIYFAVTTGPDSYLGLQEHFRLEGLAYRLVPFKSPKSDNPNLYGSVGTEIMYRNVMDKWEWGNMDNVVDGVYMDHNNLRMVRNIRLQMCNLSAALLEKGDPERAMEVLDEMLRAMPEENVPFDNVMMPAVEIYMELASDTTRSLNIKNLSDNSRQNSWQMVLKLSEDLMTKQEENITYFTSLAPNYYLQVDRYQKFALQIGDRLVERMKYFHPTSDITKALEDRLTDMESKVEAYERNLVDLGDFAY